MNANEIKHLQEVVENLKRENKELEDTKGELKLSLVQEKNNNILVSKKLKETEVFLLYSYFLYKILFSLKKNL